MSKLALLLISLYLNNVHAQTAAPAPVPAAAAAPKAEPKAEPKADPKADPKAEPPKPAAQAEPAPVPAPKPGKKGKEEPPPPPVKTGPFKAPNCAVAEFRAIGIDNPDERTRRTKAIAWLKKLSLIHI